MPKEVKKLFGGGVAGGVDSAASSATGGGFLNVFGGMLGGLFGGKQATQGQEMNQAISGGLTGAFEGITSLSNIGQNKGMSDGSKRIARVQGVTNAVTNGLMQSGNPLAMGIGAGLKVLDFGGGLLMKNNGTSKAAKDFKLNDDVMSSSGYTGVADKAMNTKQTGDAYVKSGMFGKLFGGNGGLKGDIGSSQGTQTRTADILKTGRQALEDGVQNADMVANRNRYGLYNTDMWTSGNIQFGQQGMKVQAPKLAPGQGQPQANPKPIGGQPQGQPQGQGGQAQTMTPEQMEKMKVNQGANEAQAQAKLTALQDGYVPPDNVRSLPKPKPADKKVTLAYSIKNKLPQNATMINTQSWDGDVSNLITNALASKLDRFDPANYGNVPIKVEAPVPQFKDGGAINVIVDGKLHAHKHDIKSNPEFEDVNMTGKGIPVVSKEEGGEIRQHAEVEKNELILHLDLTKQLEELLEDGSEDAMIKAGKLLAKEIVGNTVDSSDKILENA